MTKGLSANAHRAHTHRQARAGTDKPQTGTNRLVQTSTGKDIRCMDNSPQHCPTRAGTSPA